MVSSNFTWYLKAFHNAFVIGSILLNYIMAFFTRQKYFNSSSLRYWVGKQRTHMGVSYQGNTITVSYPLNFGRWIVM